MSDTINIFSWIQRIFLTLIKLEDDLSIGEMQNYESFNKLSNQFKNIDNEWRYFFILNDKQKILSLLDILLKLQYTKDKKLLNLINDISKSIIDELLVLQEGNVVWNQELIEQETNLKKKLRLILDFYELQEQAIELENSYNNLEKQRTNIESEHQKVKVAQAEANRIIEELKGKNEAFNQLIDDKNNAEIKTLYEKIYDDEIKLADKYRNWALSIFAVIGVFLLFGFLNLSIQNWNHLRDDSYIHIPFGWDSLLKTLMLFSLTTPAWYLTRESSKHRKVAYKAKMLGTELASFPLYAREFKDEDRLELRKSLADRFFGQELYNGSSNVKNTNDVSIEQVKLIAEANKVLAESLKIKQNLS